MYVRKVFTASAIFLLIPAFTVSKITASPKNIMNTTKYVWTLDKRESGTGEKLADAVLNTFVALFFAAFGKYGRNENRGFGIILPRAVKFGVYPSRM